MTLNILCDIINIRNKTGPFHPLLSENNVKNFRISLVIVLAALVSSGCVENNYFTGPAESIEPVAQFDLAPWAEKRSYFEMTPDLLEYELVNTMTFFSEGVNTPEVEVKSENSVLSRNSYYLVAEDDPNSTRRIWTLVVHYSVKALGEGKITATARNSRSKKGVSFSVTVAPFNGKG